MSLLNYVPHVPSVPCALVPCVPRAVRVLVTLVLRALRALVPRVSCAHRTLRASCPTYLVPYVLLYFTCLVLHMPRALLFPYVPYCFAPCVLYVLISPFLLLRFHAPRSYFSVHLQRVIFLGNFTKGKTNTTVLKWRSVLINSMIYLNYLLRNKKTYTYIWNVFQICLYIYKRNIYNILCHMYIYLFFINVLNFNILEARAPCRWVWRFYIAFTIFNDRFWQKRSVLNVAF